MLSQFGVVLLFFIVASMLVIATMFIARLLRPNRPSKEKLSTYECGEEPIGSTWVKFNIRFYIIALIFLIFDVEVVFLFPWALVYQKLGMFAFIEMMVFLAILVAGYIYVWVKGDLDWDRPRPRYIDYLSKEPVASVGQLAHGGSGHTPIANTEAK